MNASLIMVDPSNQRASGYSENIDFTKIIREAAREMNAEDKYQRENDAKFRAVYQKVATYEEFCDIVVASNLKPLDKTDSVSLSGAGRCTWNVNAVESTNKQQSEGMGHISIEPRSIALTFEDTDINSQSEFYRVYGKLSIEDKYLFLLQIGGDKLLALFPTEIDVFDDIMLVLSNGFKENDFNSIVNILHCIASMKKFSLSIQFIDKTSKSGLTSLLKLITEPMTSDEIEKVVSVYNKYL